MPTTLARPVGHCIRCTPFQGARDHSGFRVAVLQAWQCHTCNRVNRRHLGRKHYSQRRTRAGPTKLVSRAAIPRRNTSRSSMPCSICKAARLPTDDRMPPRRGAAPTVVRVEQPRGSRPRRKRIATCVDRTVVLRNGGSDGARTRDLRRDRPGVSGGKSRAVPIFVVPKTAGNLVQVGTGRLLTGDHSR
jgi:hypothetical protein